jgi:HIRAN domain
LGLLSMILGGKQTAPADDAVPPVIRASIHRITVLFEQARQSNDYRIFPQTVAGESHYQNVLASCFAGEPLALVREPDNSCDRDAIRIDRVTGETIGYLPRDTRLHDEFPDKISARLVRITGGTTDKPSLGAVLEVMVPKIETDAKAGPPTATRPAR